MIERRGTRGRHDAREFPCARAFDPASSEIRIFVGSQFQCKSVHGAPLCLANGTMNPQKARHVKFCSSSTAHRGDEAQWATWPEDRRDADSMARKAAASVIDSKEERRHRGRRARNQAVVSDSVTRLITRLNRGPRWLQPTRVTRIIALRFLLAVSSLPSF